MIHPNKRLRKIPGNKFEAFAKLIDPVTPEHFFENYWEKKHLHLKNRSNGCFKKPLFSLDDVWKLLDAHKLTYESDLNICRCKAGKEQEMLNEALGARARSGKLKPMFHNEGCTIQFFQPQRYLDEIWRIMFQLEEEFGCLWGSNVYLTPKNSQGLAVHFDDVEVFVLQTEGTKTWSLYASKSEDNALAMECSGPLPEHEIGKLLCKVELQAGDLLYLPRGTLHCAITGPDSHSTHITLSTYQRNSMYDFLSGAINPILDSLAPSLLSLRKGLPLDFLKPRNAWNWKSQIASTLTAVADAMNCSNVDEAIESASKQHVIEFLLARLPPPTLEDVTPNIGNQVRLRNPSWMVYGIFDREECETHKGPDRVFRIVSCTCNDRMTHMGPIREESEVCNLSFDPDNDLVEYMEQLALQYPKYIETPKNETLLEFTKVLNSKLLLEFCQ